MLTQNLHQNLNPNLNQKLTQQMIEDRLSSLKIPHLQLDWVAAGAVRAITIDENTVLIDLRVGYPILNTAEIKAHLIETLQKELAPFLEGRVLRVELTTKIHTHVFQTGIQSAIKGLPQVKNVIAVASGKGGVGKSTTAVHLALALKALGAKVGILDADIYGPSLPTMLGVNEKPEVENNQFVPIERFGLQVMSIGFLIEDQPFVWRGPMVSKALQQLFFDTKWASLDYLIVDLPPGTGDIQLTLAQKIPVTGAVIVTTPQEIALIDAKKALQMFQKVGVFVLGIIENMSGFVCNGCSELHRIFGEAGGKHLAEASGIALLGQVPIEIGIREGLDVGDPLGTGASKNSVKNSIQNSVFIDIAERMTALLSLQPKDYQKTITPVVLESI